MIFKGKRKYVFIICEGSLRMLILISPAKKLDFTTDIKCSDYTKSSFSEHRTELINIVKRLTKADLSRMMKLSDKLADLNYHRYQNFKSKFTLDNSKQSIYAFRGDTYVGLDADSLSKTDVGYAQNHLKIISGLYGLLRPLDLIQPYRLEMGTKISTNRGENLYDFWGNILTKSINDDISNHQEKAIINLASNEYIKSIRIKRLEAQFITVDFKEIKQGIPKTIGVFAKRARGMMARYIIKNRIENTKGLVQFNDSGYQYQTELSTDSKFVFTRLAV